MGHGCGVRAVACTEDDLKLLIAKGFVICFESGVIVITHWHENNVIRKERKKDTLFLKEKQQLMLEKNNVYSPCLQLDTQMSPKCHPADSQMSAQYNIVDYSIIENNKENIVGQNPTAYSSEIRIIIDYLNSKLGTHYKTNTASTRKHITARLREGYTVDNFKTVIDSKSKEWRGTDNQKYLRPETLFGSKFEGYLNAAHVAPKDKIQKLLEGYNR